MAGALFPCARPGSREESAGTMAMQPVDRVFQAGD